MDDLYIQKLQSNETEEKAKQLYDKMTNGIKEASKWNVQKTGFV